MNANTLRCLYTTRTKYVQKTGRRSIQQQKNVAHLVAPCRGQHVAVRAERHRCGQADVRPKHRHTLAVAQIEDTDGIVIRRGDELQALWVGMKGDGSDDVGVVAEAVCAEPTRHVPHAHGAIRRARGY